MTARKSLILAICAALLISPSARAETWTSAEVNALATQGYVCGLQRMKAILHKPADPMVRQAEEFCEVLKTRSKYEPELWQWMYPNNPDLQTKGDPVIR